VRRWTVRTAALLLAAASAAACARTPTPGVARGKDVYKTCVPCHGAAGGGNRVLGAPAIAGLPAWYVQGQLENFRAGRRGYAPFDTTGIRMKSISWALDLEGDVQSVAEYVATLPPTDPAPVLTGDAAAGQAAFVVCSACHGADGTGNEAIHAPPLVGKSDWYVAAQLRKFRDGWRGTDTADVWGQTMRPNAMALDSAGMANVVAYIQTLRQGSR
jgi:cytochrome c oxidase subunit 2